MKPLALLACLGPTTNLLSAQSLQGLELAATARIFNELGYDCQLAYSTIGKRDFIRLPRMDVWDVFDDRDPEILILHQAIPNIMGGVGPEHVRMVEHVERALPKVKAIYRLVVDNNETMTHDALVRMLKAKCEKCSYRKDYRENGPLEAYCALWKAIEAHSAAGTFTELRLRDFPVKSTQKWTEIGITTAQLELTRDIYGVSEEKHFDFCYIGTNRANKKKAAARLANFPDGLLKHENAYWGGSLFRVKSPLVKAWANMANSKAHIITRDSTMVQRPLHRYMQALYCGAVPIVVGEKEPVGFIHDPELQSILRVSTYDEALNLVKQRDHLKPALDAELLYWRHFDLPLPELSQRAQFACSL